MEDGAELEPKYHPQETENVVAQAFVVIAVQMCQRLSCVLSAKVKPLLFVYRGCLFPQAHLKGASSGTGFSSCTRMAAGAHRTGAV